MAQKGRSSQPHLLTPIPLLLLLTLVALIIMGIFIFNFSARLKARQVQKQGVQTERKYQSPTPPTYPGYTPLPNYLP